MYGWPYPFFKGVYFPSLRKLARGQDHSSSPSFSGANKCIGTGPSPKSLPRFGLISVHASAGSAGLYSSPDKWAISFVCVFMNLSEVFLCLIRQLLISFLPSFLPSASVVALVLPSMSQLTLLPIYLDFSFSVFALSKLSLKNDSGWIFFFSRMVSMTDIFREIES